MAFEHVVGISLQSRAPEVTHFYLRFKNVCILILAYTVLFFPTICSVHLFKPVDVYLQCYY